MSRRKSNGRGTAAPSDGPLTARSFKVGDLNVEARATILTVIGRYGVGKTSMLRPLIREAGLFVDLSGARAARKPEVRS
jgi:ABC-type transport system involved in cytochrome c biogenesis ATPase subunit